jgi:hypothetical protein
MVWEEYLQAFFSSYEEGMFTIDLVWLIHSNIDTPLRKESCPATVRYAEVVGKPDEVEGCTRLV